MFGYILPEKPELKIKEYELFRAYYCGVCKSIGKRYGTVPRFTLTYDSAFLALLLTSLDKGGLCIRRERCLAHPFNKRSVVRNSEIVDYASDMNILLAYYNLEDNWRDEHSLPSLAAKQFLVRGFKKNRSKYGDKCVIIENRLKELAELEKSKCASMDMAAEPFAKLMEEILAYRPILANEAKEKAIRWIGYNMGKWIYTLDAYDDLEKNIRQKTYNALIYQFTYHGEDVREFKARIKDRLEFNLTYSLNQIAKAYELLEIKRNASIVENIIYMGMLRKTEQILGIGSCKRVEKSV